MISPTVAALKKAACKSDRACMEARMEGYAMRLRRLMRRADGRAGWRLGLSAASNDDGEERDQHFGAERSRVTIRAIDAMRILPFATH